MVKCKEKNLDTMTKPDLVNSELIFPVPWAFHCDCFIFHSKYLQAHNILELTTSVDMFKGYANSRAILAREGMLFLKSYNFMYNGNGENEQNLPQHFPKLSVILWI